MEGELILVRHGEPERGLPEAEHCDPWLSALGRAQARCMADALVAETVDAVHSSPLRRAVETAAPLCADRGIEPHLAHGLAEFDAGCSQYLFFDDLKTAGDPRYKQCMAGDLTAWETDFDTFRATVVHAVGEIAGAHPGGRVLLSTHGGVINTLLGAILELDRMWFFHPDHGGISRVAVNHKGRMRIVTVNERAHLDAVAAVLASGAAGRPEVR